MFCFCFLVLCWFCVLGTCSSVQAAGSRGWGVNMMSGTIRLIKRVLCWVIFVILVSVAVWVF